MFLSSVRVRSSSVPCGRTDTLTSKRSDPSCICASEIPSSTTVWRSSCRKRVAELDRHLHRALVRHRKRARMSEAHGTRARVLGVAEPERAAAEHLRLRLEMDVDLAADDRFPVHLRRSGTKSNSNACSSACA